MDAAVAARPRRRGFFHPANRVRPLVAWRSVRKLLADPESTGEVFKIIEALKGRSISRAVERMEASPSGSQLLATKPRIIDRLNDRDMLAALPAGSLGRAYYEFVHLEMLSADGLVSASEEAPRYHDYLDPDECWMADRLRDIHDLQHVLTGYGRDELGELCLLNFMHTQTNNRGIAFIAFMGLRKYRKDLPGLPVEQCAREGREIARKAAWLPEIALERRLHEPLEALRRELRIDPPALYLDTRERCAAA